MVKKEDAASTTQSSGFSQLNNFMKEKKVLPLVVSMSLPMVISMAVNALYNIIDSYFVAKISEDAMTALSFVFPIQNLINAVAVGFGVGINACVAFCLGSKNNERANRAATQGIFFSMIHGILLTILCILGTPVFLSMFTSDTKIIEAALAYANRVFLFCPVITLGLGFEKMFQAVGKMKISMFSLMCGCIANIILDPLMIFGVGIFPEMGIRGAAYATGIGQTLCLVIYLIFYEAKQLPLKIKYHNLRFHISTVKQIYSVGCSATLTLALPSLLISVLNGILAPFGESYVLVLGIYYKLQTFIYMTANGIVQGIRPLIGYNYGAGEHRRVNEIFRTSLILILCVMVIGTVLSWSIPEILIGMFTSNQEIIQIGIKALRIISLGFIVSGISVTCCGSLEGLGKGFPSLLISLLRYIITIIPAALLFSRFLETDGIWISFVFAETVSAIFAGFIYRTATKSKKSLSVFSKIGNQH